MIRTVLLLTASLLAAAVLQADELQPTSTTLTAQEQRLAAWLDQREADMLSELKQHVGMNTGTDNIPGLDAYRTLLAGELQSLGFTTSEHDSEPVDILTCEGGQMQFAKHLLGKRSGKSKRKLFLNGHMDTVFSPDDEFQTLTVHDDGTLHGPGVADMKGGIVALLFALRALEAEQRLENANLTVLFNSDEEIGSLGSRALIEKLARQNDLGFVFESSHNHRVTRARKGLGQARLKITGRESHAGGAHEQGVSANLEMAHKVVAIEQLTDYERKISVNVGTMQGGEKRNTISGCADAYIDMRYPTAADGQYLESSIRRIAGSATTSNPRHPGVPQIDVWTRLHRPVKEQNATVDALISEAMGLSQLLGEPITGTQFAGGGTDGSIAQAAGLPTMDSLGLDGKGAHSSRESSTLQSLVARSKLIAVMLNRYID